jgi:hypothetical protein
MLMCSAHIGLTARLRQAGAVTSDCQPRGDPGLAWSRMVMRIILHRKSGSTM